MIGERIKQLRKREKLTQAQFAERIGACRPSVSNWEKGNYGPNHSAIQKIVSEFKVTIAWLMGETNHIGISSVQNSHYQFTVHS